MRIVVTGATGFIGTRLVAALRAQGDTVVVLSRDAARARTALGEPVAGEMPGGLITVSADLQSPGAWTASLADTDAVVHLAGEPITARRWDARQKQLLRDSRVETTRTLVEAIAALPTGSRPRALVTASGTDYYPFAIEGEFDDDEVKETDPAGDSFLARLCRDWEAEAFAAERSDVRVVAMRTGLVLGPGGALAKLTTPFRWFVGGRIASGHQWVPWIHLDDAVRAYVTATIDDRYTGPINLVTDSVRNAELSKAVGASIHRPSWLPVPSFALRTAVGEFADYLIHGRRVVPSRLRTLGFTWAHPKLSSALTTSQ